MVVKYMSHDDLMEMVMLILNDTGKIFIPDDALTKFRFYEHTVASERDEKLGGTYLYLEKK